MIPSGRTIVECKRFSLNGWSLPLLLLEASFRLRKGERLLASLAVIYYPMYGGVPATTVPTCRRDTAKTAYAKVLKGWRVVV